MDKMPYPPRIPVSNRLVLFDSLILNNCMNQSIVIGIKHNTEKILEKPNRKNAGIEMI